MEITEIRLFPVHEERLKAYVTITLDNCFVIRDLKIIHGNNGLFVAMPSKKRKDGTFKDIAHPLNSQTREMMEGKILESFEEEMKHSGMDPIPKDTPPAHVGQGEDASSDEKRESDNPEDYDKNFGTQPN